jgi:hypothetical protein
VREHTYDVAGAPSIERRVRLQKRHGLYVRLDWLTCSDLKEFSGILARQVRNRLQVTSPINILLADLWDRKLDIAHWRVEEGFRHRSSDLFLNAVLRVVMPPI